MSVQLVTVPVESSWGVKTWNRLLSHQPSSSTLTVLFPGANYPCEAPLLWYARKSAVSAGSDVLALEYGYWAAHAKPNFDNDRTRIIDEALTAIQQVRSGTQYRSLVFVSKSVGTYMAGEAAKRLTDLPIRHLFLTPIPSSIPLMLEHGGVVVVGDGDQVFQSEHLARLSGVQNLAVTVVPGADHALEVNDTIGSVQILGQISDRCAELVRRDV